MENTGYSLMYGGVRKGMAGVGMVFRWCSIVLGRKKKVQFISLLSIIMKPLGVLLVFY